MKLPNQRQKWTTTTTILLALLFLLLASLGNLQISECLIRRRLARNIGETNGRKAISAPLLGDEIDLENIEGVEQLTRLVLIKTDSLPVESNERIDGRYLNSLMETLYTGLRKPFKSVSADILGIFPSFEEIQVRCERPVNYNLEKDESIRTRRGVGANFDGKLLLLSPPLPTTNGNSSNRNNNNNDTISSPTTKDENYDENSETNRRNDTMSIENDLNYVTSYKSSLQVCRAVTDDCLSMENLVQILPPTITTFDKALVRLCPIMLFRIMNHLCHKTNTNSNRNHQNEFISAYQAEKIQVDVRGIGQDPQKDSITLNTLLRESQILKNLQNSDDHGAKKPQKLHKKLKTQTPYKGDTRLNAGGLQQHGSVDEQLLKIRLKLTEPSIEKVWIFSLLFVILSIVVSMGGLIVLPFVRKTTRRRILTLFEGLAVGGLAGSATLHMFPQAFGLVDENYHKYFWRIFVVFLGIYLCYLCERIIKILKVMRAKIKRRSRASLVDMEEFCYGFPSVSREISKNRSRSSRLMEANTHDTHDTTSYSHASRRRASGSRDLDPHETTKCKECMDTVGGLMEQRSVKRVCSREQAAELDGASLKRAKKKSVKRRSASTKPNNTEMGAGLFGFGKETEVPSMYNATDLESVSLDINQANPTRQRLRQCLKSVQSQFSPVYAVQTQNLDCPMPAKDEPRAGRLVRLTTYQEASYRPKKSDKSQPSSRRNKFQESVLKRIQTESKQSMKKYMKQRDIETMLYHRGMDRGGVQGNQNEANLNRGYYVQQRLSRVNDVAAERQDQDNAARMSVDTVAWMIVFGDAVLNVIDGLSIGAAFERNILAGISISVAVMLEEVTHRLGTFAVLIRAGMSMQQSLLCTFLSACALFPGLIVGILLSDATEDATPYIFCAAGGIFLYMALVDVMKEMNRSIENAIRKDIKSTLQIFALQNVGIVLAVIFLSFLALYEQAMDFEEYQMQYNHQTSNV